MKTTLYDSANYFDLKALPLKNNLLRLVQQPELLDADGKPFAPKTGDIRNTTISRAMCDRQHVQLDAKLPFTVTYTLNPAEEIEKFLVSTYSGETDFGYGRYEIYAADERDTLYAPENQIGEFDRRGKYVRGDAFAGTAQIFTLSEPEAFHYFGIRFTHGCALDGVVRLDFAGAFREIIPEEETDFSVLGACLTQCLIPTQTDDGRLLFDFKQAVQVDTVLVYDADCNIEYAPGPDDALRPLTVARTPQAFGKTTAFLLELHTPVTRLVAAPGTLLGAYVKTVSIRVLPEVIHSDFLGAGTNVLPTMLMEESLNAGYDPDFFKQDEANILALQPKIIRVWFQNDWFQTGPETYDFTLPKMQAFLKYMRPFAVLGTEIELDFSFTVGSSIQSWYTIREVKDKGRSAPRDLNMFARSVVAALKFLFENTGLNIRYITLSNEPENRNFAVNGDVSCKIAYYAQALRCMDDALKNCGLRERVEIWGCEDSAQADETWLREMKRLAGDVVDRYTKHVYFAPNDTLLNVKAPEYKQITGGHVCLTEFGSGIPTYEKSTVGTLIAAANAGLDTALHWALSNAMLPDPLRGEYADNICLWQNRQFKNKMYILPICNEYGPALRYVPAHCEVLQTACSHPSDLRVAVFRKGDDVTVVVNTNESGTRELKLDVGCLTNKPFKRVFHNLETAELPQTVLPKATPVQLENGCITETLRPCIGVYYYTTLS